MGGLASSEIPTTVPFPPCGENCAVLGIFALSDATRFAGLAAEGDGDTGCDENLSAAKIYLYGGSLWPCRLPLS